jgi:hypothetical protein
MANVTPPVDNWPFEQRVFDPRVDAGVRRLTKPGDLQHVVVDRILTTASPFGPQWDDVGRAGTQERITGR